MKKYLSVCSGIEAASVAWEPLGWEPLAFSEIEKFPRAVLSHHYPDVPLYGDFTKLRDEPWIVDADILVGGTPCQAFSVAGLRNSLADDRGNLTLEFVRLANAIDDLRHAAGRDGATIVWENVPGVLSTKDNAFGCFLAALVGADAPIALGRKQRWTDAGMVAGPRRTAAWRVFDAQYFGLAQRRERVFVVADSRNGSDPSQVLFEPEGVRRYSPPRREAGEITAGTLAARPTGGGFPGTDEACEGYIQPVGVALRGRDGGATAEITGDVMTALRCGGGGGDKPHVLAFHENQRGEITVNDTAGSLKVGGGKPGQGYPAILAFGGNNCSGPIDVATTRTASASATGRLDFETETFVCHGTQDPDVLRDMAHPLGRNQGQENAVAIPIDMRQASRGGTMTNNRAEGSSGGAPGTGIGDNGDPCPSLSTSHTPAVAFAIQERAVADTNCGPGGKGYQEGVAYTLEARNKTQYAAHNMAVRRLLPTECEALQGFPRDYTLVPYRGKPAADGPRYKALGNSMAVPVMAWIGRRIDMMDRLMSARAEAAE